MTLPTRSKYQVSVLSLTNFHKCVQEVPYILQYSLDTTLVFPIRYLLRISISIIRVFELNISNEFSLIHHEWTDPRYLRTETFLYSNVTTIISVQPLVFIDRMHYFPRFPLILKSFLIGSGQTD